MRALSRIVGMAALGAAAMAVADPVCDTADLIHRWSFNGNLEDSVGGLTATSSGAASYDDEANPTAIRLKGNGHDTAYVNLGTGIVPAEGGPITIEIWATQHSEKNWSRIFDFGPDNQNYLLMSWTQSASLVTDAVEIKSANTTLLRADNQLQPYNLYVPYHISLTLVQNEDGKATLSWAKRDAVSGAVLKSGSGTTSAAWDIASIANWTYCCIGRSQYTGDSDAMASYDEVRIWKTALTEEQLTWSAKLGPDMLPTADVPANCTMTLTCNNGSVSVNGAPAVAGGSVAVPRSPDATLTAVPAEGYTFVRWTGDTARIVAGNVNSAEITVNSTRDFALSAEFEPADNVVYARYEDGAFVYLTPGKGVGNAPQGGMNEGITILFSSDDEYQQLRTVPEEVAKAGGLELGGNVKLTDAADWTALDYSFAGYSVDLNGKVLVTRTLNGGSGSASEEFVVNGGFDEETISDGAQLAQTPKGWNQGEKVYLMKNNTANGYSNRNGSNWLYIENGGYAQQNFSMERGGNCTLSFKVASKDSANTWKNSSCLVQIDGVTVHNEYTGTWSSRSKSYSVPVGAGSHTLKVSCNGGGAVLVDNMSLKLNSFAGVVTTSTNEAVVNGSFQADTVADGARTSMTPQSWTKSNGNVYLLKNNTADGYSNRDGSNWLYLENGGWVQQPFTTGADGACTLSFKVASRDAASSWKNSSCYVQIDGNNIHNAYTGSWNASTKTYTVQVNAGTHTLKVGCNGGSAVLVDNVSLKCPVGFVVDVPAGKTLVNDSVCITGAGVKLKKTGAGTLVANKANQSYTGGTAVSEGQLTIGNNTALGAASEVSVDAGATLELNGKGDIYNYSFVLNGGTLQNTVADVGSGMAQIAKLKLTADSTFKPTCSYGLIGSGYAATTLDLGGHRLTVPIGSGKSFWLFNTTVTAGTLDVSGDGWLVADKTAVNASAADLVANCALDIRVPFTVGSYEAIYASDFNAGDVPLTVTRSFKPHSSYYHGVQLAKDELIDLSACSGTLNTPGLFTSGANSIIFPVQEVYTPVDWIESSGTQWIHTGIIPGANTVVNLDFTTLSYKNDSTLFGCASWNSNRFLFIEQGDQLRFYGAGTAVTAFAANTRYTFKVTADHKAELYDSTQTLLNSVDIDPTNSDNTQMTLFALNGGGYTGIYRMHAMKIYDGETLVRDFVPCRDQTGAFGLWDRVQSKFYASQGTGAFTGPAEAAGEPLAVLPPTLNVNLHGRDLEVSKIIGWATFPDNVIFEPTEATRNDHLTFDIRPDGIYVPRNTVIYFR